MSYPVCANPKCPNHEIKLPPSQKYERVVSVEIPASTFGRIHFEYREVTRHLYRREPSAGKWYDDFYFCEVCHEAIEMVKRRSE